MSNTSRSAKFSRSFSFGRKARFRSGVGGGQDAVVKPGPPPELPIFGRYVLSSGPDYSDGSTPQADPTTEQQVNRCSPNIDGGFSCKTLSETKPRKKRCQCGC